MLNERTKGINFNLMVARVKKGEKLRIAVKRLNESENEELVNKLQLI